MHSNYYFLRQLTTHLRPRLINTVISECFSQQKDELIIRFETDTRPFFIRASLQAAFSCLSFPDDFARARKNSVDLFQELIGTRVIDVVQFTNERSFAISLTDTYQLLFKLHGNRANVILLHQEAPMALFRNHLVQDMALHPSSLNRTIDWSREAFEQHRHKPEGLYVTFGKIPWRYLHEQHYAQQPVDQQWQLIQALLQTLEHPTYSCTTIDDTLHLTLVPTGTIIKTYTDPLTAVTDFFHQYISTAAFRQEKQQALQLVEARLQGSVNYLAQARARKQEIEQDDQYKAWADILMANLHAIPAGADSITLPDFYHNNALTTIRLRKELTAQKNAEVYYRKSKNQHIEITRIAEAIAAKEQAIPRLQQQLEQLRSITDLRELRQRVQALGLIHEQQQKEDPLPYHEVIAQGFRIWIGKSARHNDILTQQYAFKEDLWLHAKDVPGSHVVIKYQAGKPFPKPVIERAAALAAYYSKRKTDTLCPVLFTPRKYVRKRKGDPPGAVVVEREEVMLVEPEKM